MRQASVALTSWMGFLLSCVSATAFAQSADLGIGKTAPATATVGSNVTYTVTIQNNGPDAAANAVMTDNLPTGATFVSDTQSSGPAFVCTDPSVGADAGTVTCTLASMLPGDVATFQITVNVSASAAGSVLINSATASSDTPDDNPENNTSSAGTQIAGGTLADVGISKSGPAAVGQGATITYTIVVTDNGPNDASNVSWDDVLGAGLTFVSLVQNSGPTFTCPGSTTPCSLATLPNGASATFTLTAQAPASSGTFNNTATVTSANDPNPENDSSSVGTTVANADVGVTKSAPPTATAGGTFNYTVTLSNGGPDGAVNARFNDTLPAGITFASLAQTSGPTATCAAPQPGSGGNVSCTVPSLLNGQSAMFTLGVNVDGAVANGTVVTNTATASSDSFDANGNNNTSSASTTIGAQADVAVTKTAPSSAAAGSKFTYTLSVTNSGVSAASNVVLSDTLPPGETFVSISQTSGPAFACSGAATVTCSVASLASGSTANFSLTVAVGAGVADGTVLTNTANVTTTATDTNPANNTSSASTTVQATADLSLTKTSASTVTPGGQLTYTLTLSNAGPSSAANVNLSDTLPAGETFVSFTQNAGPAFACSVPASGGGGTIACSNASFAAGTPATFTLVVGIPAATTPGTVLVNSASASSSTADPTPANNAASASAVVTPSAPAAVAATPALDARALGLLAGLLGVIVLRRERRRARR